MTKDRLHIGFITSEFPHPELTKAGGLGTSLRNLVVHLAKTDVKVSVFVIQQAQDRVFEEDGITFHTLAKKNYPFLGWWLYRKHVARYVNRVVHQEGIDALEAPDWTGITAFMRFKVPLVIRFHGSDTYFCQLEGRKQKPKNKWFEAKAIKGAAAYIAPTTYAGSESARLFGIDPDRVTTIHYGLDLSLFENPNPRAFVTKRLLNAGTLIRKKGMFELVQVFNRIAAKDPKAGLFLIGNDSADALSGNPSTWEMMKEQFTEQALERVRYLGKVPYKEMQLHIQQAHVCIFPSKAETLGMVTIESMAMFKPVVNTNYGWAQELIDDGLNGFKIDPSDIDGQAERVLQLFDDVPACHQIGEEARKKVVSTFDIKDIVQSNISYYKALINADRPRT